MLKNELQKIWSKPLTCVLFALVLLVQILYVPMMADPESRAFSDALNELGGPMDDAWRERIGSADGPKPPAPGEGPELSCEERALLLAKQYLAFPLLLEEHAAALSGTYTEAAGRAYESLREAFDAGRLIFGHSPAAELLTDQSVLSWSWLLFMILLGADLFACEGAAHMSALQAASKDGRRKLFRAKGLSFQLSAAFVWLAANLSFALSAAVFCGWGSLRSLVQDFVLNSCPYPWNAGQFLAVVLLCDFAASQVTALLLFLLAAVSRSLTGAFAAMCGAAVLPYFLACELKTTGLLLWLPALMNGSWLFSDYSAWRVGGSCLPLWSLAGAELVLMAAAAGLILRRISISREDTRR